MNSFVIINGFDRSGSSAISRTLASHPELELIMQPFNSGFIRENMYRILLEQEQENDAFRFIKLLENNILDNSMIKSHWYFKHSTTNKVIPDKIHIVKTTINHFAQRWMKTNFPSLDVWGIWREPVDIVSSIMRNNFYGRWYSDGIMQILPTVEKEKFLMDIYWDFTDRLKTDIHKTAFLLAVRTHFFLKYLDKDKLLIYEDFKGNPSSLNVFTDYYGKGSFNFKEYAKKDLNITGQSMVANTGYNFSKEELSFMKSIFAPIQELKKRKFQL